MKPSREVVVLGSGEWLLCLTLPGSPIGKPRQTRRDVWKQRPCVVQYRSWADALRLVAGKIPAEHPARVDVVATFSAPPSRAKVVAEALAGQPHRSKPDVDNILKAVLDAIWPDDDSAIAWATARKRWAGRGEQAHVSVTISYAGDV